jgi:hypothetical protein
VVVFLNDSLFESHHPAANLRAVLHHLPLVRQIKSDPVLTVVSPSNARTVCDDFIPQTVFPLIALAPDVSGVYQIEVRGFEGQGSGAFEVGIATGPSPEEGSTVPMGGAMASQLGPDGGGAGLGAGDLHWFRLSAGDRVQWRVTSREFDTVAMVLGPNGESWVNDDAGDQGPDGSERALDSTVDILAPSSGLYQLVTVGYGGEVAGQYQLRTSSQPAVILAAGQEVPTVGFAGREGQGRILGLFAGISQYGERGDLYGCADDARFLAQAFRERGLMAGADQIVLLDDQATRANFAEGLRQLAARAGENDVVMIFFSGHGDRSPASPADTLELDGLNETIILFDAPMIDDEVVGLLDGIHADTVVLALDACHSGGFARDFMTRPGRYGLFSSDEDILSDTAEVLRAGGYLSHFLREAVLGEADTKPHDGALRTGELADYLYDGFIAEHGHINPAGDQAPYQRLIAERGSLAYDDLMWIYPRDPNGVLPWEPVALESAAPVGADVGVPSCQE